MNGFILNIRGYKTFDLEVIEVMKLAALSEVQKWYEDSETW
jgi:hypothetical protein